MTQKSAARQMRDAQKKQEKNKGNGVKDETPINTTCWTDLNNMYSQVVMLFQQHMALVPLASDQALIEHVSDKQLLVDNITRLTTDLKTLSTELTSIHNQHKDLTGGDEDMERVWDSIKMFEQYQVFVTRYNAIIIPTAVWIGEQLDGAHMALAAQQQEQLAAEQALDKNVITDVEFSVKTEVVAEQPQAEPAIQG